jgi:hypothetical protein
VKRSDIPDEHVLELARRWRDAGMLGTEPGVVSALVEEGIPVKLARAKVLHLVERHLMDYGVSEDFAWPR